LSDGRESSRPELIGVWRVQADQLELGPNEGTLTSHPIVIFCDARR
jgi:hypothetical protein